GWGALAVGAVLFFVSLYYVNFRLAVGTIGNLGVALPLALLFSGLWHLARTWAWAWCFPQPRTVSFARLARVRLAAEAFSYLTLRGIAGEPLKVVLLGDVVDAREATAAVAVERQMLELVRGNPRRLVVLLTATSAAYLCMALEAWIILRATGAAISPTGALAVETFSRVASFASAFIPANLGALEASSLAAVAAIGATSGGAALALARRLRGLFWAGIGLAIYPRRARASAAHSPAPPLPRNPSPPT